MSPKGDKFENRSNENEYATWINSYDSYTNGYLYILLKKRPVAISLHNAHVLWFNYDEKNANLGYLNYVDYPNYKEEKIIKIQMSKDEAQTICNAFFEMLKGCKETK